MSLEPPPDLQGVFEGNHRIVVLAPHPDDESLACGALLARAFSGAGAHVICLTDGGASHPASKEWPAGRLAQRRRAELARAVTNLGGSPSDVTWFGMTDSKLYQADPSDVAIKLAQIILDRAAEHIFVPAPEDHHEDHKATALFAREVRKLRPDWSFYSYPVWSRWDDPNFYLNTVRYSPHFLKTGAWQEKKSAAIYAHQSQLGNVVEDDPDGFVLPAEFIEKFIAEDEVFWRMV